MYQITKNMKIKISIAILMGFLPIFAFTQSHFPIKLAISNESTAIPYTKFFTRPIHPTLQVGTEYIYINKLHSEFYQTANLGYIYHKHLYQGVYVNTGIGYDLKTRFGLRLKSNLEIGYLHTFSTQDEYQFKNGEYVNGIDKGNSRVMPILSVGLGFSFKKENKVLSELFALYKSWIEYPYSPGFIPLMSHINLEIGYKFYLKGNDRE